MTGQLRSLAAAALLMVLGSTVQAHTLLGSSTPSSGSVLTQSPPVFTLTFLEPARLTSLVLVTSAGERRLSFSPSGNALTFATPKPGFTLGRNEIRWKALSQDGHVIEGSIIIVLRPAVRQGA